MNMFSLQLKELRQLHKLSQKELAKILNVSTGTVGNWEAGNREPDFSMALKIADYFDVSLDRLIGRENRSPVDYDTLTPNEYALLKSFRTIEREIGKDEACVLLTIADLLAKKYKKK